MSQITISDRKDALVEKKNYSILLSKLLKAKAIFRPSLCILQLMHITTTHKSCLTTTTTIQPQLLFCLQKTHLLLSHSLDGHKTHYMRHKTSIAVTSPYFPLILYSINFCTQVQMCKTAFVVQETRKCEENTDTSVRSNGWYQRDTCIGLLAQCC